MEINNELPKPFILVDEDYSKDCEEILLDNLKEHKNYEQFVSINNYVQNVSQSVIDFKFFNNGKENTTVVCFVFKGIETETRKYFYKVDN